MYQQQTYFHTPNFEYRQTQTTEMRTTQTHTGEYHSSHTHIHTPWQWQNAIWVHA